MVFDFSAEHVALRQAVREVLDEHGDDPAMGTAAAIPAAHDRKLWRVLAEQLGLAGLAVPEKHGGAGAGPVELAIVMEEMGRTLYRGPFFASSVLGATLLAELGDEAACADFLPDIASGQKVVTVALAESPGDWTPDSVITTAADVDGEWRISGEKSYVLGASTADLLLVVACGPRVFAVDPAADGVSITPMTTLDSTRPLDTVVFEDAAARPLGAVNAADAVARTLRTAEIMLAVEQVGGARRVLDMAVDYAKQRFQFGRAIGSFQAIKHMCADLFVDVESAFSAAYFATWALADGDPAVPALAGMAKAFCSEVFVRAASDNIQIHGGIGFTWEHPAHLFLRRARSSAQLLGDAATHRERWITTITAQPSHSSAR